MNAALSRVPWPVSSVAVVVAAAGLAFAANWFAGPYFERTFLDEDGFVFDNDAGGTDPTATPAPGITPTTAPSPDAADTPTPAPQQATLLARGEFQDGDPGHNGRGQALIARTAEGELVLRVENFSVTNGPDLFVYLAPEPGGGNVGAGLNLGELKATDGNFNYEIPAGTDVSAFRSVIVWCRQFDVNFAFADLEVVE